MESMQNALNGTRAELLNLLEGVIPNEKWPYIRGRILKLLGRNGLESKIQRILMEIGIPSGTDRQNEYSP